MALYPVIPEYITVHLGKPDAEAENVTVSFPDYIKNVASSEIYPTWPESTLEANILAEISFALNRVYTEYYRSRGYPFDITNSTSVDQSFIKGRDIFENISDIVDNLFTSYIKREGQVEPLFASYCDGIETTCAGLSQWGSAALGNEGLSAIEILRSYYGNNIEIVSDVPVEGIEESAPPRVLQLGSTGDDTRLVQTRLNRISKNYPAIPKIEKEDGFYGVDTENAVKKFQSIFSLPETGTVNRATWYKIQQIYNSVKKLSDLNSEGLKPEDVENKYPEVLQRGDTGYYVRIIQYFLQYVGTFVDTVQPIEIDGIFGPLTEEAVKEFQQTYGLPVTGIIDDATYEKLYSVYLALVESIPVKYTEGSIIPFPGLILRRGMNSLSVKVIQEYLAYIAEYDPDIPKITPDGSFGQQTLEAVEKFQEQYVLPVTGQIENLTWDKITQIYKSIYERNNISQ